MENKKDFLEKITDLMKESFDEAQKRPNQYVVAYYKVADDNLIGYHRDSFCNISKDILDAKRYSGENPYSQLEIIAKNLKFTLEDDRDKGLFVTINKKIQADFDNLKIQEVYLDAIYLAEGTPKQNFTFKIINNEGNKI